jgi:hypothetical protein
MSHRRTRPFMPAVASRFASGEYATICTVAPSLPRIFEAPPESYHERTVPSSPAEAIAEPSGANAALRTLP